MLKQRALSATFWSAIEQIGARGLSTIFMLIFARLLTAEDFGIFAAGTLAIGFASRLAVFGLNTVVVQRSELDTRALSTAFWIALSASTLLALALVAMAEPLAALFEEAAIAPLIPALALGMVLSSATSLVTALLRRELNMKAIARRTLLANALSGLIAMPFILNGYGAWGLVVQSVGGAALTLILTVMLVGWPVKAVFDTGVAREMLRFGAPVTGADLLTYYNRESPKLFVGLMLGVEALGLFAMAMRVMNLLLQVLGVTLTKVTLPVMSQVNRATPDRMGEIYLRLVRLAGAVILPIFLLVIVFREPLVTALLGARWVEIIPVVALLCGAGLLTTFNYLNGSTIVSLGKPQARLWFSIIRASVGTALFLLATPFGIVASSAAFLLRGVIVEPIQLLYLLRKLGLSMRTYLSQTGRSALATLAIVIIGTGSTFVLQGLPPLVILIIGSSLSVLGYGAALYLFDKSLITELRGITSSRRRAK
ncbi:lipopolysaccharide biosynthesis protein [Pararhodobacter sp.]|uniref:lipopolysaccharide biosynthesis protein n=1 Tax=Pararhodobacter sp. TaxID=2127056 RepID=UPI002FDDE2D1